MDTVKLSKFLSLVLRHKPEEIGLTLDRNGWADVKELLHKLKNVSMSDLESVVENNNKKRFTFNETKTKIRANQGHSVEVDLQLKELTPPDLLYHGTATRFIDSIKKTGIEKRDRHHVHLSSDEKTAESVGIRHGKPVIIVIDAMKMFDDGHKFFLSQNGVWLTDKVEPKYFSSYKYL